MEAPAALGRSARSTVQGERHRKLGLRPKRSKHALLLNQKTFAALMTERRKTSVTDIAAYLEMGVGTVYNAMRGKPISDGFVSALMKKLGGERRLEEFLIPAESDSDVAA